ncbi:glycosyltransferase family 4 protein [Mangrovimonas sp. YM274]|uniref:glycosyltransferase family 4 protein n=1 Tax=Mangrovimonas sp. YM274 TaxID=3070660 RepID=UPI0027DCA178|nr:glycosyltransferase family 4 protein [Mangrovimonas sp. YM274]WMI69850.1 glycosyltransferase family 4 protein [Mangrovimonas sp. YM274]
MKIAIFSGSVPSTTFIEHVILGVASTNEVLLFGVRERLHNYESKNIKCYITPKSHYKNLLISTYRVGLLAIKAPKDLLKLIKVIKKYPRVYDKWIWFTKFLPIILYRPDVFHIQWARDLEFYWFLKEQFDIKIVVSFLGSHINYSPIVQPYMGQIYKEVFPLVDGFHAVSKAIALEGQKYGANSSKIKLIRSPIQETIFSEYRPPQKHKNQPLKLISVGRHHWVKGYKFALLAISYLYNTLGIECHYTIIAQGSPSEELLFMRNRLGLEKLVSFQKGMPQETLFKSLQTFDALLLPSLNEGVANVVLEAMALGIPVISSDCGGMDEVVLPGKTGWLVPVYDPEAMAKAVLEVIHISEEVLQRITQNAHDLVKAEFCAEHSIQQFLELYDQVLGGVITSETRAK